MATTYVTPKGRYVTLAEVDRAFDQIESVDGHVHLTVTPLEMGVLYSGFNHGIMDDAIDSLGFEPQEKAAVRRVQEKIGREFAKVRRQT